MSKLYLIIPIFAIYLVQNTFSNPFDYIKSYFVKKKQKPSQLQRQNNLLSNNNKKKDNSILNDYVIIDKDSVAFEENEHIIKQLNELNKGNSKQIEEQYNETKKEYQKLIDDSKEQMQLSQNKLNKQTSAINDINSTMQQYNNKNKLKNNFQRIINLLSKRQNLEIIYRINNVWKNTIQNSITVYKFNKQYVKDTWSTFYEKNKNKLHNYDSDINQIEVLNLNKAMDFIDNCYNKNKLNETLQKIISTILRNNNIEVINRGNKAWNSAVKLAINKDKLSKEDVKDTWKVLYNKNIKLLEDKIIYLCYIDENGKLYKQVSNNNLFDLESANEFIDSI